MENSGHEYGPSDTDRTYIDGRRSEKGSTQWSNPVPFESSMMNLSALTDDSTSETITCHLNLFFSRAGSSHSANHSLCDKTFGILLIPPRLATMVYDLSSRVEGPSLPSLQALYFY